MIFEGESLGVANSKAYRQPRRSGISLGGLDQIGAQIDADDAGSARRNSACGPAGAGRNIKDVLARLGREPNDAMLDRVADGLADPVVTRPSGPPNRGRLHVVWQDRL